MSGHFGGNGYAWDSGTNAPHVSRYFIARGWVMPGETVIDAGCATGYGTHLIGQVAKKVIGLEVDPGCIAEANGRWKPATPNADFRVFDLDKEEWPDADTLISIENAEHVQDLQHFIDQAHKHIKRCIVLCVPLGGTSWDYTPEQQATPAGENNDFNNEAYVEKLFVNKDWKLQTNFRFGYSGVFVFFKKPPRVPKGYNAGAFPIEGYIAP